MGDVSVDQVITARRVVAMRTSAGNSQRIGVVAVATDSDVVDGVPSSPIAVSPKLKHCAAAPLGVDPEAVIDDPVLVVTALVQGLQVTQDICVGLPGILGASPGLTANYAPVLTLHCRPTSMRSKP